MVDRKHSQEVSCTWHALTVLSGSFYMAYIARFLNRLGNLYAVSATLTYISGQKVLKIAS